MNIYRSLKNKMSLGNYLKSINKFCGDRNKVYDIFQKMSMNDFIHFRDCVNLGKYFHNNGNEFRMTTLWQDEKYVVKYCLWNNDISKNMKSIHWNDYQHTILKVLSGKIEYNSKMFYDNNITTMCELSKEMTFVNKCRTTHTLHYFQKNK